MLRALFIFSLLLFVACTPADKSSDAPGVQQEAASVDAAPTDPPSPAPVTVAPTPTTAVQQESPTAVATSMPAATAEPTIEVVATIEPTAQTGPQVVTGRTADGAYFIGAVDAPVTIIDYSDFL